MFITVLTAIYASLVVTLAVVYATNQRSQIVKWAENHGMKNNFFVRVIKKKPRKKSDKSRISKAFMH